MFDFIVTIVAFIVGLGLLITFHEFGHFWVARRCGVKILCFSVGFGKAIFSKIAKDGAEYKIGFLPLGGYVKMLGEQGGTPLSDEERRFAFSEKSVWARIAIVFAGPLFNFMFAFFAYLLVGMIGIQGVAPFIGGIASDSIAQKAGLVAPLEIVAVDDKPTQTWQQVINQVIPKIGDKSSLKLSSRTVDSNEIETHVLSLKEWNVDSKNLDLIGSLGIEPAKPAHPAIINTLTKEGAAEKAGLLPNDQIVMVAGLPIADVEMLISEIEKRPEIKTEIQVLRKGEGSEPMTLFITPAVKVLSDNRLSGYIGVTLKPRVFPPEWIRTQKYSFLNSFKPAYQQTVYYTQVSFKLISKLIVGKLSPAALSGPISIAQGAGTTFKMGFQYYLSFLALISISLGVINLLPIPLLDGGHLFYYLIEIIIRRPVPQFIQDKAAALGIVIILGLMGVSFYNDIMHLMV